MKAALSRTAGISLRYANRHGLITGATGTGKTVSLMRLAESFSAQGVPVFVADVKGDIAALVRSCPATVLDVFGKSGLPLHVTVQGMGADLMARALELTDTQAGCLEIAFAISERESVPLNTLGDLRDLLGQMLASRQAVSAAYGQVTAASVGVIQRGILRLEQQGGGQFFAAPAFDIARLLEPGLVSILAAERLIMSPRVYGAFLLHLLSELWERLPEIGDSDKPRLVLFFDEAHLIFQDCPAALMRRIEQTVRLIRSKGVGVYFVTQSPNDVPDIIKHQLAHVIAHDRSLSVGSAKLSTMDSNGRPMTPQIVRVDLPTCPLGALSDDERRRYQPPQESVLATPVAAGSRFPIAMAAGVVLGCLAAALYAFDYMGAAIVLGFIAACLTVPKPA